MNDPFIDPGMEDFIRRTGDVRDSRVTSARAQSPALPSVVDSRSTVFPPSPIPVKSSQGFGGRKTLDETTEPSIPFYVRIIGSGPGRQYEVISNGGVVRDGWEGANITVTGIDTEATLGTDAAIWMNFPISGGVATSGAIETGAFPEEVVTTGSDDTLTQTDLNVLIWQESDDRSVQVLHGNLRVFSSPIGTLHTVIALPST